MKFNVFAVRQKRYLFWDLLLLLSIFLLFSCGPRGLDEIYLIPSGYSGAVVVLFDENVGEDPNEMDGKIIYNIGDNGELVLKRSFNEGRFRRKFFFVDKEGNVTNEEVRLSCPTIRSHTAKGRTWFLNAFTVNMSDCAGQREKIESILKHVKE